MVGAAKKTATGEIRLVTDRTNIGFGVRYFYELATVNI